MNDRQPLDPEENLSAEEWIGPFRLLGTLGEGGMGIVHAAEQREPLRRRVALKVIKLGMDTKEVLARFEQERQALAVLDHPNIAKVLDAGATKEGRPWFAMELVRGTSITRYCDQNQLPIRDRIEILLQACAAVQHAHERGILHRDIKPSNLLVAEIDGHPVLKVIDFGLAKATRQKLTQRTIFTEEGRIIGTPEYMSPEQADLSAVDVDARSDVYSLGVVLYELLAGALPFDFGALRARGYLEIERCLREQEPPTPSKRLSTLGADIDRLLAVRRCRLEDLARSFRSGLDAITMKALARVRRDRYASCADLAADLRRFLDGEALSVRNPNLVGTARRSVLRLHGRLPWLVPTMVGALVVGALVWWQTRIDYSPVFETEEGDLAAAAESRRAKPDSEPTSSLVRADRLVPLKGWFLGTTDTPPSTHRDPGAREMVLSGRAFPDFDKDRLVTELTRVGYSNLPHFVLLPDGSLLVGLDTIWRASGEGVADSVHVEVVHEADGLTGSQSLRLESLYKTFGMRRPVLRVVGRGDPRFTSSLERWIARRQVEAEPQHPLNSKESATRIAFCAKVGVLARSEWQAMPAVPDRLVPLGTIRRLTLHHSAMLFRDTDSASCAAQIQLIQRSHMDREQGYADIGYHFLVDPAGRIWEGRPLLWEGAHARAENNRDNIGICVLGNFMRGRNGQDPNPEQLSALEKLLEGLRVEFGVGPDDWLRHSDFVSTECPGPLLNGWYGKFLRRALSR